MKPRYPIYIISKGRADSRLTSKALERMGVDYKIVIEPQEKEEYEAVIDPKKILLLPIGNHGNGSGYARNWVWEHSISIGAKRHWIMDDNILDFYRYNYNRKLRAESGAIFAASEDFVDRFTNVMIAGFQYDFFIAAKWEKYPPFTENNRIFSCLLIDNSCKHRWRGRYNEDVDLSIRVLKDGDCTILFNAFLQGKAKTQSMKGGNMDEFYAEEGTFQKSLMLVKMHPDITKMIWRYGRWHHHVNFNSFKNNELKLRPGFELPTEPNEYGMKLLNTNLNEYVRL